MSAPQPDSAALAAAARLLESVYMELENHVRKTLQQLKLGPTIGRRETPVISYWSMRAKWIKWGSAWKVLGTDGDIITENAKPIIPAILQLVYIVTYDGNVCQMAYVIGQEVKRPELMKDAKRQYDHARMCFPEKIID